MSLEPEKGAHKVREKNNKQINMLKCVKFNPVSASPVKYNAILC